MIKPTIRKLLLQKKHGTVQISKRVKLAALATETKPRGILGRLAGTGKMPIDIDELVGVTWNAMK